MTMPLKRFIERIPEELAFSLVKKFTDETFDFKSGSPELYVQALVKNAVKIQDAIDNIKID